MREIKFRGKRIDNGEWVYGQLTKMYGNWCITNCDCEWDFNWVKVIPETVCQFTGLRDKNGAEICEGDVVIWNDGGGECELKPEKGWIRKAIVRICPDIFFEITPDSPTCDSGYKFNFGSFLYTDTENHLRVIGNIHGGEGEK